MRSSQRWGTEVSVWGGHLDELEEARAALGGLGDGGVLGAEEGAVRLLAVRAALLTAQAERVLDQTELRARKGSAREKRESAGVSGSRRVGGARGADARAWRLWKPEAGKSTSRKSRNCIGDIVSSTVS